MAGLLAHRRLTAQQIARHAFASAREVVAWMGAVQAQDYLAAKWALGLRLPEGSASDAEVERAIAGGSVVRTHALRGTWQLVAPEDLRWIQALVRPRLLERNALMYRRLGLDARAFKRGLEAMEQALRGGDHLTRNELASALERARVSSRGLRLTFLLQRAELEGLICGGTRRGKQFTYALVDLWVPRARKRRARGEALAALARRYFRSRGPATVGDFGWWSGLAAQDARDAVESVRRELEVEEVGERTFFHAGGRLPPRAKRSAYLLPAYDEYLVAYQSRDAVIDPGHARRLHPDQSLLDPVVVLDGHVAGFWRRALGASSASVELALFERPSPAGRRAIDEAAERYGAFLGMPVEIRALGGRSEKRNGRVEFKDRISTRK